jgi:hypothetical protein
MAWRIANKGELDSVNFHLRATVTAVALVNGATAAQLGPEGLEGELTLERQQRHSMGRESWHCD